MIAGAPPYVGEDHVYLSLGTSQVRKHQLKVPLSQVERALSSDSAVVWPTVWKAEDGDRPVVVKIVRNALTPPNNMESLAKRERLAYERLAEREGAENIARCYGVYELSLKDAPTEPLTIFVLEKLGLTARDVAAQHPKLRGSLAGLILRDGLSAVLELESVRIASRDPHPSNLLLVDSSLEEWESLKDHSLKMIDLGTSYLMGGGTTEGIETHGTATGLLQVQPPAVVRDGEPHRGLIDDAFSIAASAYMAASNGHSPYVRRSGATRTRVTWGRERDKQFWEFDPDYASDLDGCEPDVVQIIRDIFETSATQRQATPAQARSLVETWQRRAAGGSAQSAYAFPTYPEPASSDAAREPSASGSPVADRASRLAADSAREWLRADRIRHIADQSDFLPKRGWRYGRPRRPIVTAMIVCVAVVLIVTLTSLFWPQSFQRFEVLPTSFDTFADWQTWFVFATWAIAVAGGVVTAFVLYRRPLWAMAMSALSVALLLVAGGILVSGLGAEQALAAAEAPLGCEGETQPPVGSHISCADTALPDWWKAGEPWVQTSTKDGEDKVIAFDSSSYVGFNTGAQIIYPFTTELTDCTGAWLYVYQSTTEPDWNHSFVIGDETHTASVLRSGSDIARFAEGRNTWKAYEWSDVSSDTYSSGREYILTSRGQDSGLGSTQARLLVIATDCAAGLKPEIDAAGTSLLQSLQLGNADTLDPAFVRLKQAESPIAAEDFATPITDRINAVYPWGWATDGEGSAWEAGTTVILTSASGEASARVWTQPLPPDGVPTPGWVEFSTEEEDSRGVATTFVQGDARWQAVIWVQGFSALGEEGDEILTELQDGIRMFGQEWEALK